MIAAQCVTRKRQVATLTLASGRTAVAPCDVEQGPYRPRRSLGMPKYVPQKCRFLLGSGPQLICDSLGSMNPNPKRHPDWFSRFAGLTVMCPRAQTHTLLLLLLLHPFNGRFSRTTWVSRYQKGKTSLDLNEARDDGVLGWKRHHKQSAHRSRQITTSTLHH